MTHRRAALVIAVIVALAEAVVVYDLWLAGTWLTLSALSVAKTAAFVMLFIGSLIAEMQPIARRVRWLLFGVVLLLGSYQAGINIVVNYAGADVPQVVTRFVEGWISADATVRWYAVIDGAVRSIVVVLMWAVVGLVWRGDAIVSATDGADDAVYTCRVAGCDRTFDSPVARRTHESWHKRQGKGKA